MNTTEKIQQIGAYFIWGLLHQMLTPAEVITAFDGNAQPWERFNDPDSKIIQYLMTRGEITDFIAFQEAIGDGGRKRLDNINQSIIDVPFNMREAIVWAASIEQFWQVQEATNDLRQAIVEMQKPDVIPSDAIHKIIAKLSGIASLTSSETVNNSYEASEGAKSILRGLVGLGDSRYIRTGLYPLDEEYGGAERGKILAVGGLPGCGKTAIVDKMTTHAARQGNVVVWLHEIPMSDMRFRTAIREKKTVTRYQLRQLRKTIVGYENALESAETFEQRTGYQRAIEKERAKILENEQFRIIDAEIGKLSELPIVYRRCAGMDSIKLLAVLQSVRAQYGRVDMVVVDHIQLFKPIAKVADSFSVRQTYIELRNHIFADFPDTALVSLQHLNKDIQRVYNNMIIPSQSDFAYGGDQEMDMGLIAIRSRQHMRQLSINDEDIVRMKAEDPDKYRKFNREGWLWVVKARDGQSDFSIRMDVDGEYYDWSEAQDA